MHKLMITVKERKRIVAAFALAALLSLLVSMTAVLSYTPTLSFTTDIHWGIAAYDTEVSFASTWMCDSFTYDAINNTGWLWHGTSYWSTFGISAQNANVTVNSSYTSGIMTLTLTNTSSSTAIVQVTSGTTQPVSVDKDGVELPKLLVPGASEGYYYSGSTTVINADPTGSAVVLTLDYTQAAARSSSLNALILMSSAVSIIAGGLLIAMLIKMADGEGSGEIQLGYIAAILVLMVALPIAVAILGGLNI